MEAGAHGSRARPQQSIPARYPKTMAPTPTSLNIPDISSVQDEEGKPVWNGDKTLLSLYLVVLERWLFKTHPDYRILFEKGYLVDRNGRVVVYSPDHATAIAGTPPTGYNFRNPAPRVTRSDTALTEPQRERFNRAPELIDVKDSTILDTVLGTITTQSLIKTDPTNSGVMRRAAADA